MRQTLIFGQDVAKSKDARRVREPWKIRLHRAWPSSMLHKNLSGLEINDILFPLSFDLGESGIFWRYYYCRWPEDQTMGSALMPIEGLFLLLASIQAQIIVKEIRRNETATIKIVRKKPLRHWCDWGDLVELSFMKQNVLQRSVSKLLNEPPYGRQNQTNSLEKLVLWNHNLHTFWLTFAMIYSVDRDCIFIYVFQTFESRTRANQAHIGWNITGLGTIDLWHEFNIRKTVLKASGTRFLGREGALLVIKSRWVFPSRAKFLNKTKDFFKSPKYYLRM